MTAFKFKGDYPLEPVPSRTVATAIPLTMFENLDIDEEGNMVITSFLDGRIWQVPFGENARPLSLVDGRASSIARGPDGQWLVFGSDPAGAVGVYEVRPGGLCERIIDIAGGVFPNGVQRLDRTRYLLVDSIKATIWEIDHAKRSVDVWLRHPLLAPVEGLWIPGLNGIKLFGDTLYMSNSAQQTMTAVKVSDGKPYGEPWIVCEGQGADDFALDIKGSLYLTTHVEDKILRLDPDGRMTQIAGVDEGIRGCTACRFGRRPGDENGLYVVTDGGLFAPHNGIGPARVVRLETGVAGAPIDYFGN